MNPPVSAFPAACGECEQRRRESFLSRIEDSPQQAAGSFDRRCPRLVLAALRGGSGKTTISVALTVALRKRGIPVVPFKKGPDYIDAAWLSRAAAAPCYNLDTFLIGQ